jgi:hypothetical protein
VEEDSMGKKVQKVRTDLATFSLPEEYHRTLEEVAQRIGIKKSTQIQLALKAWWQDRWGIDVESKARGKG